MRLELDKIRLDGDTQPREKILNDWVNHLTELLRDGKELKPVTVFFDGKHYWLADGFHRYHAHKNAGFKDIAADVINGSKRKAWIFSLSANGKHGARRTIKDRRNSVVRALGDIELSEQSDRSLAKICDVSRMTVARVKKEIELEKSAQPEKPEKPDQVIKPGASAPPPPPTTPPPAPYDPKEDQLKELAAQHHEMAQENANLKDRLAIKQLPANEDVKAEIEETIGSLRKQVESLERELRSVTLSRNDYQQKNSDLLKQVTYWKRRAEKAEKAA
jgi:ParB-like chromosome segregation protein Spo0J